MKKLNIELNDWMYECGDGCCTTYGTTTKVNGVEIDNINEDREIILQKVLEHLGFEVEIETTYNGK